MRRYRGIHSLDWAPAPGWNCIIGPGDSSKSNVLAAIALLLSPVAVGPRSEYDYHNRDVTAGFEIEAIIGALNFEALAESNVSPAPWGLRSGNLVTIPEKGDEAVLRVRVSGTEEFEAIHEIILPSGDTANFPVSLRKRINLFQLRDDAVTGRTFRLSPGSVLGKEMDDTGMRKAVHNAITSSGARLTVPHEASETLQALERDFFAAGLPCDLGLGLIPVQSGDLLSIVALHSGSNSSTAIPMANFGTGTREMAALLMVTRAAANGVILTVDEVERGLEPHRQRSICDRLIALIGLPPDFELSQFQAEALCVDKVVEPGVVCHCECS